MLHSMYLAELLGSPHAVPTLRFSQGVHGCCSGCPCPPLPARLLGLPQCRTSTPGKAPVHGHTGSTGTQGLTHARQPPGSRRRRHRAPGLSVVPLCTVLGTATPCLGPLWGAVLPIATYPTLLAPACRHAQRRQGCHLCSHRWWMAHTPLHAAAAARPAQQQLPQDVTRLLTPATHSSSEYIVPPGRHASVRVLLRRHAPPNQGPVACAGRVCTPHSGSGPTPVQPQEDVDQQGPAMSAAKCRRTGVRATPPATLRTPAMSCVVQQGTGDKHACHERPWPHPRCPQDEGSASWQLTIMHAVQSKPP